MRLPKEFTTVTPFSKFLAMALFIALPLFMFFVGIQYQKMNSGTSTNSLLSPGRVLNPTQVNIKSEKNVIVEQKGIKKYTSQKIPGLSFSAFSIEYPTDWEENIDSSSNQLELTLIKSNHHIKIRQAPVGGAYCVYSDNPKIDGPAVDYTSRNFVEVQTPIGLLRRAQIPGPADNMLKLNFCVEDQDRPGYFLTGSKIGNIRFEIPQIPNVQLLQEMDNIIKTIREVQ